MSSVTMTTDPGRADAPLDGTTDLQLIARLLGYVRQHTGLFIVALLLYPLTAATVVIPPYLVREILDVIIPAQDVAGLQLYCGLYLLALALEYASALASQFSMSILGQRAMRTLRRELFGHVQRLPARFYDRNPIGRTLTRLTNDIEALGEVFATGAVTVIGDVVSVLAVVGMMLWLDVQLTLMAFLVVPPLVALTIGFRSYARRAYRAVRKHLARINTFLAEHISGMGVVQLFSQERRTLREFSQLSRAYRDANRSSILFDALLFSLVEAVGTTAVAAIIWAGAPDLTTGVLRAGTLVAFVHYIRRFFIPIRDLSTKWTVLQSAFAAAERIFLLLDEPVTIDSPVRAQRLRQVKHELAMSDVWFSYRNNAVPNDSKNGGDGWVLRGVDLRVRRGEKIALVGSTGSGKTTILKLLNRTYDIQRGIITIDNTDIRQLDLNDLRRRFAVVLQDVYLFSGTIMANLAFADDITPASARQAAEAVQADDFIRRLPRGYQTPVSELGSNFSAGERQLLAFARAMARNPDVLVLDEATSNIDSETEARIQSALDTLLQQRTAIVVAHRLSTIRKVDRIVVLDQGRIVEEGDHEALMKRGGMYSALAQLQFSEHTG